MYIISLSFNLTEYSNQDVLLKTYWSRLFVEVVPPRTSYFIIFSDWQILNKTHFKTHVFVIM